MLKNRGHIWEQWGGQCHWGTSGGENVWFCGKSRGTESVRKSGNPRRGKGSVGFHSWGYSGCGFRRKEFWVPCKKKAGGGGGMGRPENGWSSAPLPVPPCSRYPGHQPLWPQLRVVGPCSSGRAPLLLPLTTSFPESHLPLSGHHVLEESYNPFSLCWFLVFQLLILINSASSS